MGIELIAGAIIAAVGLTGTAATIGTVVVGAAISAGLGVAAMALMPKQHGASAPTAAASITSDNRKVPTQDALPPRRMVFGTVALSGPIFFFENQNPFLYMGYVIGDGVIDGLVSVRFNGIDVAFGANGRCIVAPYATWSTPGHDWPPVTTFDLNSQKPYLYMDFRNGDPAQAGSPLLTGGTAGVDGDSKPTLGLLIPSSFRQCGVATCVFRAHFGADQPTHNVLYGASVDAVFTVQGLRIFDPRATQDFDDYTTWTFSNNPALCIAHWLCRRWQNPLAYADIDWPSFVAAANHCDEPVAVGYGDTEPRYQCDGIVTADQTHFDVLQTLLTCCAGALYYRRGKVSLEVGVLKTAVLTITDRDIVGDIQIQHDAPLDRAVNRVRTTFISPERSYVIANGPVLDRPDYQALDGRVNEKTLELPFTASVATVQRIAKRFMVSQRLPRQGTLTIGPIGQLLDAGDVINVQSQLQYLTGTYEVHEVVQRENGVALTLAEYSAEIEDWSPARDLETFVINPVSI
jgi:hypothetical protein